MDRLVPKYQSYHRAVAAIVTTAVAANTHTHSHTDTDTHMHHSSTIILASIDAFVFPQRTRVRVFITSLFVRSFVRSFIVYIIYCLRACPLSYPRIPHSHCTVSPTYAAPLYAHNCPRVVACIGTQLSLTL